VNQPSPRRAATRERLVRAGIGVIARKGVLGASVEEICEAAGFTRGAFYSNFDSKDELCLAILETQAQDYLAAARDAITRIDAGDETAEQVARAATHFISTVGREPDAVLVTSELRLHAAREPALRGAFDAFESAVTPLFADLIHEGLSTHGLRLTIPVEDALSLLHAVYDQTALDQLVHGQPLDAPEASRRLGLVLRALIQPA